MKIGFFGVRGTEKELLQKKTTQALSGHEIIMLEECTGEGEPSRTDFDIVCTFVASHLDAEDLAYFPDLKFVATRSTGYDHIDLAYTKEHDILVSNVPAYGSTTVAEFTFALLLTLSRKIFDAYEQVRETGSYDHARLQGFDLEGKTLGVIGTGKIGMHVVHIARGFGMKVYAYDIHPNESAAQELGFGYGALEDVLKGSDVVTLHVPYLESTHHLMNEETFSQMKDGAYLINTSRGPVVDTEALVRALESGKLAGAGIDVVEEEDVARDEADFFLRGDFEGHDLKDVMANHILVDMPNVIVTPHIAYNSEEAMKRILDITIANIKGFIDGSPINLVS